MTDDDPGAHSAAAPKLTLGQRLLTALPSLQRTPAPSARSGAGSGTGSDSAVVTPDAVVDAEGDDATPTATARGGRVRDSLSKPPAGAAATRQRPDTALAALSNDEIVLMIKKIDDRERLMALFSAVLGVVVGILLTVVTFHINPAVGAKNHQTSSLILLEGGARILLSGVVVGAAMSRRRSLVGFSLLFLGTSMGSPLFALPFWALGGYLIWRVFKYQKALNARGASAGRAARSARDRRVPADPRGAARAGAAAGRDRARAARQRGRTQPQPAGPTPSKRYTPPKPTRPRPPAPPA